MTTFYRLKENGSILDYTEFDIATETTTQMVTRYETKEVVEQEKVYDEDGNFVLQDVIKTIKVPYEVEETITIDHVPAFIREQYIETERRIIKLTDGSFAFEDEVDLNEEERKRIEKEFNDAKNAKLNEARTMFVEKRDARRFIQLDENRYYGFDCASEDITNFMARWSPLAMMGEGESDYKVWFNETEKGLVKLSLADYNLVYKVVSDSQLEAYAWYEKIKAEIMACNTIEELEEIKWGEE